MGMFDFLFGGDQEQTTTTNARKTTPGEDWQRHLALALMGGGMQGMGFQPPEVAGSSMGGKGWSFGGQGQSTTMPTQPGIMGMPVGGGAGGGVGQFGMPIPDITNSIYASLMREIDTGMAKRGGAEDAAMARRGMLSSSEGRALGRQRTADATQAGLGARTTALTTGENIMQSRYGLGQQDQALQMQKIQQLLGQIGMGSSMYGSVQNRLYGQGSQTTVAPGGGLLGDLATGAGMFLGGGGLGLFGGNKDKKPVVS